ncbi:MAG: tRNA guanosine(34) transglycosylase Tgt [Saprospiraceae bacterium]
MNFTIEKKCTDTSARLGILNTDHGSIETPIFMPVGTQGTVKCIYQDQLKNDIKAQIILGNTYHLYLRPGIDLIEKAGGLHKFIAWDKPILTDSGGYQVYSLSNMRKITEEGVSFKSHIDGSSHFLSPEIAVDIQRVIGADIIMAFDECTPYPCDYHYAKKSIQLTHRWLQRCFDRFNNTNGKYGYNQTLAPIVQGSTYIDLRKKSAQVISEQDALVYAIGGLSVGEPAEEMYEMTAIVTEILPQDKPRYLMGVGTPANLLESIALGVDMFDCVMPTRNARHGLIFTSEGIINIKNAKWKTDLEPLDKNINCTTSNVHSRAYFHHLFRTKEMLGLQMASLHNLTFYLELMQMAREKIKDGTFFQWKNSFVTKLQARL